MKVIDLLNKIANGEEVPKKIKHLTSIYTLRSNNNYYVENMDSSYKNGLYYQMLGGGRLNDEVEIIEEDKKIEKFELPKFINEGENTTDSQIWNLNINLCYTRDKINEIIDKINKEK